MKDIELFVREHYIGILIFLILYYVFLLYWLFHKAIHKKLTTLWGKFNTLLQRTGRSIKASFISAKYKIYSIFEKCGNKVKYLLKKHKGQIFFLLFYVLYIAFFVFLVIFGRMQEADVAFKYIVFPLYFAVPILFSNVFEKIEALVDRIEAQAGISTKRKRGGSFASENEIKSTTKHIDLSQNAYSNAGIPIIYDGGKTAFVEDSESHSLIIGSTGCGKTRRVVLPLINIIAKTSESFIATDPKGELYSATRDALLEQGFQIQVLNFRNPQLGNSWNPLSLPYRSYLAGDIDKAIELLNDLGISIFSTNIGNADPFWDNSAIDYFIGLALALFEDANSEAEVNFNSIYNMSRVGERTIGNSRIIKKYFEWRDENSIASISASGTIYAPTDTRGGILSVFHQKIRLFNANKRLSRMLSNSDFDISDIANKKTAVFIIIQDEKSTYHPLASAFLKQTYEELVRIANTCPKGKLPRRINYILDEFANLPQIADMDNIITASRSRHIRMYLIVQGIKQLNSVYGDNIAEIIKGNCDYWYYMMSKELPLLKEISELCGCRQEDDASYSASNAPLVSITDLQLLQIGEVLVLQKRLSPFLAHMQDIDKYIYFSINEDYLEPPERKSSDPAIFRIRDHVANQWLIKLKNLGVFSEEDIIKLDLNNTNEILDAIDKRIQELEKGETKVVQEQHKEPHVIRDN